MFVLAGRSVSVDPQSRSPKRTSRPPSSHAPPVPKTERRPRPSKSLLIYIKLYETQENTRPFIYHYVRYRILPKLPFDFLGDADIEAELFIIEKLSTNSESLKRYNGGEYFPIK